MGSRADGTRKRGDGAGRRVSILFKLAGILLPLIGIAVVSLVLAVRTTTTAMMVDDNGQFMEAEAEGLVREIRLWMDTVTAELDAQRKTLEFEDRTVEEERRYLLHMSDPQSAFPGGMYYGTTDHRLIHATWVPDASYDPAARGWYQDGLRSDEFRFRDPYVDAITNMIVVPASAALRDAAGNIRGVAAGDVELTGISALLSDVRIEETGGAFLADTASGVVIGAGEAELAGAALADLPEDSIAGRTAAWIAAGREGPFTAEAGGRVMEYYLSRVPESGWTVVAYVPRDEVMSGVRSLTARLAAAGALTIAVLFALIVPVLLRLVVRPVRKLDAAAVSIAAGDLDARLEYDSNDEFGALSDSFGKTVQRLHAYRGYIDEISHALDEIADGNLTVRLRREYSGEFAKVKTAMEHISRSLSDTIAKIDASSRQVSARAEHLSDDSRSLSDGASEQTAAIQELSSAVAELSRQVRGSAEEAQNASAEVARTAERISESNGRMHLLIQSMGEMNESAGEIDKIIKIIEDIAFQTNILALNAAVEAARAGASGKGFAVVADEVRVLASRSGEAAQQTARLIQATVEAVRKGSGLADQTAESLSAIVRDVDTAARAVSGIAAASEAQAKSIGQVSDGIARISGVVQSNSDTSEQTAASSQELSVQAKTLNELVEKFRVGG